jgi:hypothetical protein
MSKPGTFNCLIFFSEITGGYQPIEKLIYEYERK